MANKMASHKKGDTWNGMSCCLKKKDGTPYDLTGHTAVSNFKVNPNGAVIFGFKTEDGTILIPNPTDGKIFYKGRKMDVPANRYFFDLQITSPEGKTSTIAAGSWEIKQNIS